MSSETEYPDISKQVSAILEEKKSGCTKENSKFKETFEKRYPQLFEMLYSTELNMRDLDFILKKYNSVRQGNKSYEETSKEVGQVFYDNYVAPNLPEKK
jgi:spore coat protein CotH